MERFWSKVEKGEGCWVWTGAKAQNWGYGRCSWGGRTLPAHRVVWEMTTGTIPPGLFVCHHCDNPACVRPDHLYLGTHLDNMRDMRERGRSSRHGSPGAANGRATLSPAEVQAIREAYKPWRVTAKELAARYGVRESTVRSIVEGKTWKHLLRREGA